MADKKTSEGLGISGFTLGILSIVFAGTLGIALSLIGGILCIVQQRNNKTRLGKIGFILNLIGLVVSIAFLVLYSTVLAPFLGGQLG